MKEYQSPNHDSLGNILMDNSIEVHQQSLQRQGSIEGSALEQPLIDYNS
jgi:hypothetical protein